MDKILDFGKTNGLGLVAMSFNIGSCTPFQMEKISPLKRCGIEVT
jgi:hypothetical protein